MTNLVRLQGEALNPAASRQDDATLHVVFRVADAEYALATEGVIQMESFTGATPVPGVARYLVGIVQVRGRVVPIIDLRLRFGMAASPHTLDSRIVIGQLSDRIVGLLVDSAREVVKIRPEQIKPPPPIVELEAQGFIKAVAQIGPRLVMLVDFAKIIGEERVHDLG